MRKNGVTAKVTKLFFLDAVSAYKIISKIEVGNILTQTMTGYGGFSEYLERFR